MALSARLRNRCAPVRAHVRRTSVAALVVTLTIAGCARKPRTIPLPPPRSAAALELPRMIRVGVGAGRNRQIVAMPLDEYVLASVLSELAPASGDPAAAERAFEVQAVLARTYGVANLKRHGAEGFDVCDTTHCQVVDLKRPATSRWGTTARRAVDSTRGSIVTFHGAPAAVVFHSDCGGTRSSAAEVWGGNGEAYLAAGPDPLPRGFAHVSWRYEISRERLQRAFNSRPMTSVGNRLDTIDVQSRDSAGRARLVLLNGERAPLVRGEDLRAVLNETLEPRAIRSTLFEIRRSGDRFVFDGRGFGHGVGLCQTGAFARAAAGETVEAILSFYFPGTLVVNPRREPSS